MADGFPQSAETAVSAVTMNWSYIIVPQMKVKPDRFSRFSAALRIARAGSNRAKGKRFHSDSAGRKDEHGILPEKWAIGELSNSSGMP